MANVIDKVAGHVVGPQGPQGPQGPKGDTGQTGPQGATGATGATPNLTMGTVTTLEPDSQATATITGTAENPVLNLGIPKGDTGEVSQAEFDELKNILNDATTGITAKLTKIESNNYAKSDSDVTAGYVAQDGAIYSSTSLWYTDKIPVVEGDEVRIYTFASGAFTAKSMRFVCAYNSENQAVSASGAENVSVYTVPDGITSIVITSAGAAENVTQLMITRNYVATVYEPYFAPYYIASEDFVKNVLDNYEIPEVTVDGYNLIPIAENGEGCYYGSSVGSKIKFGQATSYHYAIMPVEPNSNYYFSDFPRFWAFTDDNDIVTSFGEGAYVVNSGAGTKLYYTTYNSVWDNESLYGNSYAIVVAKGTHGNYFNVKKPTIVSGITQNMMSNRYGCALPKSAPLFTVGFAQTWYKRNILALDNNHIIYNVGANSEETSNGHDIAFTAPTNQSNGYMYRVYDAQLACIAQQSQKGHRAFADNLKNCTALVIGDSTVAHNTMTQKMLEAFSTREKTLTLLGTQGTSPNMHEGRSGWSAKGYCTESANNPFYNNGFDFSYYMNAQGYTEVDFVVVQLGINDLYNAELEKSENKIEETSNYVINIIDSILTWNSNQRIILNLPTALNSDQSKQYHPLFSLRNMFVRYNELMQYKALRYPLSKVRCSHCHLILDPDSDILDDVHPTATGYGKMALEVVSQINCWQNS